MSTVLHNYRENEEGGTLVFVGVCFAALLGFAALTFDLGRVAATQSDLQAFADHMALAVAGELDGKLDSIDRANAAAEQLIDDQQTFGLGAQALGDATDYTLRFLNGLPDQDLEYNKTVDDLAPFETNNPLAATLVEVTTRPTTIFLPFFRAFGAVTGRDVEDATTTARAVAGSTQWACDIATMMFCLPTDPDALARGNSIRLRTGGNGAAWGPGNFGFLDPSDEAIDPNGPCASLSGSARYQCLIASSGNRTRCFAQRGVDMNTGQAVGVENAVYNTRFDIYTSTMNKNKGNSIFAPSLHRVTGYADNQGNNNKGGGQCLSNQAAPSSDSMAFPADPCHESGCGAFGGNEWNLEAYVETNYGAGTTLENLSGAGQVFENIPDNPSRFDIYTAEHDAAVEALEVAGTFGNGLPSSNADFTTKTCSTVAPSTNPNRRVFIAAGIDCDAHAINGAKKGVPVQEFYTVFLMRPVGLENGGPGNFDLHVEMIGPAGGDGSGDADDGGIFRTVVELYR